ncbi:MAG TPA: ribulokinase, partial [Phycisphaerae bacterium]|nr:ribulokinase [Phycisphaerae bacterium]
MAKVAIGLDYGTNSVRTVIVHVGSGREVASVVWNYEHGDEGILLSRDPNLARQHPADYVKGGEITIKAALRQAKRSVKGFRPGDVIGIGVDTTGSTPLPVDRDGTPLAFDRRFAKDPAAMAWLWKDHTGVAEAEQITALAGKMRPQYLTKCGGTYSSEWFFSKVLHCKRTSPKVFNAAYTWVECADWIPAMLTGRTRPEDLTVSVCAAGHKAMYNDDWGGYPDRRFLGKLDPALATLRDRLRPQAHAIDKAVGGLTPEWAKRTGLPEGIPVAVGAFDAHLGAVAAGIAPGTLVKVLGTSSCDMMVAPAGRDLPDIPGLCGIVRGSILPGYSGLEAGQSAVGDIYNWFVNSIQPGGAKAGSHEALTKSAARIAPGSGGLLALDW